MILKIMSCIYFFRMESLSPEKRIDSSSPNSSCLYPKSLRRHAEQKEGGFVVPGRSQCRLREKEKKTRSRSNSKKADDDDDDNDDDDVLPARFSRG
jgi:hypothetical protein